MRWMLALQLVLACEAATRPDEFLASVLDWYQQWHDVSEASKHQTCTATRIKERILAVCSPAQIRIDIALDAEGRCNVTAFHRTARSLEEERAESMRLFGAGAEPATRNSNCLGLQNGSRQTFGVTLEERLVDPPLGIVVGEAALKWLEGSGWLTAPGNQSCRVYFPVAKVGDPMFHVYAQCHGQIEAIWEFQATASGVADFPHWTYSAGRGIPRGALERVKQRDLWTLVLSPVRTVKRKEK